MNKVRLLLLGAVMSCFLVGCAVKMAPENMATNEETAVPEQRIISTSVAICEILDALTVDQVIGIPQTQSTLPERYKEATNIGSPMSPDLEIVKTLSPTIVISPSSLQGDLEEKYKAAGVPSYFADLSSVEGMYACIKELGAKFGKQAQAEKLISEYESYKKSLEEKQASLTDKNVLILMGLPGSYVVATEHSYVGNLLKLAGGKNVYEGQSEEDFINVSTEDMLKKDPDIILTTAHALPDQVKAMFKSEFSDNDIWKHFKAVKENKVYMTESHAFGMSANLGFKEAVKELEGYLYRED